MTSEVDVVVRGQNRMGGVRITMRCEQFVVEGERFSDGYSRSRVEGSDEQSRSRPLLCDVLKEERREMVGVYILEDIERAWTGDRVGVNRRTDE